MVKQTRFKFRIEMAWKRWFGKGLADAKKYILNNLNMDWLFVLLRGRTKELFSKRLCDTA
ncbi:MAG: hypothetical protein QXT63_02120 [Thermoplasmata archaeon]